jgi:hypothetical protein
MLEEWAVERNMLFILLFSTSIYVNYIRSKKEVEANKLLGLLVSKTAQSSLLLLTAACPSSCNVKIGQVLLLP